MKLVTTTATRTSGARKVVAPAPPSLQIRVDAQRGAIVLSGRPLAEAAGIATRRELVDRFFSIPALRALRLDPIRGSAWLSFELEAITMAEALEALTAALRMGAAPRQHLPYEELLVSGLLGQSIEIWRAERGLTFWRMEEQGAGRFRLSHPLVRHPALRERLLDALAGVAGVKRQKTSLVRPDSIDVWCQAHRVDAGVLLEIVDPPLAEYPVLARPSRLALRPALVAANFVLAPIADFLFPPLKMANAVLVWMLNAEHVMGAWEGLRRKRCNLELLYLCVGACTLLTFQFLGAAVMYAALELWPRLVRQIRQEGQRQFLARYRRRPQRVWVERDGTLLETGMLELPAGEVVVLREGDTVPGDGVILDGAGEVRESWISGAVNPVSKQTGDTLFASTELTQGEVRVRIDHVGEQTVGGRLASWFGQALRQPSLKVKAEQFADSMVLPALIFGAAALGRGGLHMAKAVIRPDYFTGPAIAEELSQMLTIIQAAEAGFYISDQSALDRLEESDCWIFDDSVPWTRSTRNGASVTAELRRRGIEEVHFLSSGTPAEAARSAAQLGFDSYHAGITAEAKKNFIAQRQFLGQSVAYFGDCLGQRAVSEQANIAVSVLSEPRFSTPGAPVALLTPDLARCGVIHSLGRARTSSVGSAFAASLVPNIAAMTGAIYLDFSVISSVILTNLGTLASYYRWRRTLESMR